MCPHPARKHRQEGCCCQSLQSSASCPPPSVWQLPYFVFSETPRPPARPAPRAQPPHLGSGPQAGARGRDRAWEAQQGFLVSSSPLDLSPAPVLGDKGGRFGEQGRKGGSWGAERRRKELGGRREQQPK